MKLTPPVNTRKILYTHCVRSLCLCFVGIFTPEYPMKSEKKLRHFLPTVPGTAIQLIRMLMQPDPGKIDFGVFLSWQDQIKSILFHCVFIRYNYLQLVVFNLS